jgi:hypothetical protein
MKVLTILFISLFFLFIGCQDDNSILEPTKNLNDISLEKGRPILVRDLDDGLGDDGIKLLDGFEDLENYTLKHSRFFSVKGNSGGKLYVSHSWLDINGKEVTLYAELIIPRNAFKGTLEFDIIFDLDNYAMELYPSPYTFDKPVMFSMFFSGVDLSGYAVSDFDFNYLDGEPEDLVYSTKYVDINEGILKVWDAQLHHFSRYGWTRKK